MKSSDFRLPDGDRNAGTVYLPDATEGPMPAVIVCHGWGGNRTLEPFSLDLCSRLTERGMALVTFDFFGCGETGGLYSEMTYGRWGENVSAIHTWVATQGWADPGRIGTLGISSGSTAALRHARQYPETAFVISIATCLGLYISMPRSPARIFAEGIEALLGGETAEVFGVSFPVAFFRDFVQNAPIFDLDAIRCPVFFMQGSKDNPFRRSDAWLGNEMRRYYGVPVHYREIEGGDHGLNEGHEEAVDAVIAWLESLAILSVPGW